MSSTYQYDIEPGDETSRRPVLVGGPKQDTRNYTYLDFIVSWPYR